MRILRKKVFFFFFCFSCLALYFLFSIISQNSSSFISVNASSTSPSSVTPSSIPPTPTPTPQPLPVTKTISFSATGDNLIHDALYQQATKNASAPEQYDFSALYEHIAPFYQNYDINWINQETLINDVYAPSSYPFFSSPGDLGRHLYDIGFRVFSISNNHTYDKGLGGITATQEFWSSMPDDTLTVGLFSDNWIEDIVFQTVDGIKIAYLSYTEYTNGIPKPKGSSHYVILTSQTDLLQQQIEYAQSLADFVIVGLHWGIENSHITQENQKELAQQIADWGADVIIGTHPHVVQDLEWKTASDGRQVLVAYSLGNFVSRQSIADNLLGIILTFDLSLTTYPDQSVEKSISNPKAWPIITHYGLGYDKVRVYLFSDYTEELANTHGVKKFSPHFNYPYAESVFNNYIQQQFLSYS